MGRKILFNIADLKSLTLQGVAKSIDLDSRKKYRDDKIDEKEAKKLQKLLNGDSGLKAELANESDDIKNLFGYTASVQAQQTQPAVQAQQQLQVQPMEVRQVSQRVSTNNVDEDDEDIEELDELDGTDDIDGVDDDEETTVAMNQADEKKPGDVVKEAYYKYMGFDPISREKFYDKDNNLLDPATRQPILDASGNPVKRKSPQEAYEAVLNDYKGKKEYKHALKDLRKYSIDTEAKLIVIDAISRCDQSQDSKGIKKEAQKILEAEGNWDKHTKKALNGNGHNWWANALDWMSGQPSDMKLIRKAQADGNKMADRIDDVYTKEDFTKAIGKRCPLFQNVTQDDGQTYMVIEKLIDPNDGVTPMVTKVDGGYDIEGLSRLISRHLGSNNALDRQSSKADSELEAIRDEFRLMGVELTKRDTRQLVKFIGARVKHKNIAQNLWDSTGGAAFGAAATSVALATQAREIVRGVVSNHNYLELNLQIDASSIEKLLTEQMNNGKTIKDLEAAGEAVVNKFNGGVQIIIDQKYAQEFFHVASRHIGMNALKSAGIGALAGLAASLLEYGPSEEDIFSTRFKSTRDARDCEDDIVYIEPTYEAMLRYIDSVKSLNDTQRLALKQIAMNFIKVDSNGEPAITVLEVAQKDKNGLAILDSNGEPVIKRVQEMSFDIHGFQNYLNEQAGYRSNLNGIELLRAIQNVPDCPPVVTTTGRPPEVPTVTPVVTEKTFTGEERTIQGEVIVRQAPKTEYFEDWGVFASRYKCIEAHDKNFKIFEHSKDANTYARTMMKVMQAITDGNYDIARLQDLTQKAMSRNWSSALQNIQGFNFNVYKALRGNTRDNSFAMDRQNMPIITKIDEDSVVSDLCEPTKPLYNITRQTGGNGSRINLGDASNRHQGASAYKGGLITSDGRTYDASNHQDFEEKKRQLANEGYIWQDPQ